MDKRSVDIMFLAVISQALIDNLEDEIGEFKFKHKRIAKQFLEETTKLMSKDFGSVDAVDQLCGLSIWMKDIYKIMLNIGQRSKVEQQAFQFDWESLLTKYKLNNEH
jgi:hypothetical protein